MSNAAVRGHIINLYAAHLDVELLLEQDLYLLSLFGTKHCMLASGFIGIILKKDFLIIIANTPYLPVCVRELHN